MYWKKEQSLGMYFYDEIWDLILNAKWKKNFWPGCFVDWDNTPRNKHGVMVSGFSVEKFAEYMKILVQRARKEEKPVIFINAWNEWGEGNYMEPDLTFGKGYINALHEALNSTLGK